MKLSESGMNKFLVQYIVVGICYTATVAKYLSW